ncbi:MAG: peptide deformylase [Candidatus Omnitrophica bacterium]|nr:peptide deformylase [Candidatus Omnitrophota bacterium]
MSRLELKTYPDPCLKVRASAVEDFTDEIRDILKEMSDIMYATRGIGLAAPQVGLGLKMLVMDAGNGLLKMVNPEIAEISDRKTVLEEGCLSLPGISVKVSRPGQIKVSALDENGAPFTRLFDGLAAKVVQHEMDHLDGKVIIDHLDPVRRFFASRKLKRTRDSENSCEVVCHAGKEH